MEKSTSWHFFRVVLPESAAAALSTWPPLAEGMCQRQYQKCSYLSSQIDTNRPNITQLFEPKPLESYGNALSPIGINQIG